MYLPQIKDYEGSTIAPQTPHSDRYIVEVDTIVI